MRRILALISLLILGAGAYRVGYPWTSPVTIVAGAPEALADQGTARFKLQFVLSTSGQQPNGSEFTFKYGGDGEYDFVNKKGRMSIKGLPSSPSTPSLGSESIFQGADLYMNVGNCPTGALGGKQWLRLDATNFGMNPTSPTASDPTATLDALRGAGEVTEVGREKIEGIDTTHYRVKVDIDKALAKLPEERRDEVRTALENLKKNGVRNEVWIDDRQLPRRFRISFETKTPATGAIKFMMTQDFLDYGKPVNLEVPSEDQVYAVTGGPLQLTATIVSCYPARGFPGPPLSGVSPAPQSSPV